MLPNKRWPALGLRHRGRETQGRQVSHQPWLRSRGLCHLGPGGIGDRRPEFAAGTTTERALIALPDWSRLPARRRERRVEGHQPATGPPVM